MTRANLSRANLRSARLAGTQLTGANLSYAELSGADLIGADLTNANLTGANINGAVVSRQNKGGMSITKGINFEDWKRRGGKVVNDIASNPPKPSAPYTGGSGRRPVVRNSLGMEFVSVPAGRIDYCTEKTGRLVYLRNSFLIGVTEVTQRQWQQVMGTDIRQQHRLAYLKNQAYRTEVPKGVGPDYAMYYVNWEEAREFARRLSARDRDFDYRLPSQIEFLYAARAGTTSPYYYGDEPDDKFANIPKNFLPNPDRVKTVKGYPPNPWGLYDIEGNVTEWMEDRAGQDCRSYPSDGSPLLSPSAPDSRSAVVRGNSWQMTGGPDYSFGLYDMDSRTPDLGFRLVAIDLRRAAAVPVTPERPPVTPAPSVPQKLNAPMRAYPTDNRVVKLQGVRTSGPIRFGWHPVRGAVAYIIEVQELKSGRWVPHTRERVTGTVQWVQRFPLGQGRWRLTTLGPNNFEGHTTQWWSFKLDLAINPF
ncbi:MAG: SUMF1/EgtB/PvdO family nonheme iron enzyme [Aridibacter famidurans]|nr:SUMF1/EgtB/PvdO family nonheme iron enzyme [Aridibacter famidurans]